MEDRAGDGKGGIRREKNEDGTRKRRLGEGRKEGDTNRGEKRAKNGRGGYCLLVGINQAVAYESKFQWDHKLCNCAKSTADSCSQGLAVSKKRTKIVAIRHNFWA